MPLLERSIDPRIRIELELQADHPSILGDQAQIESALLNLCVNARDAMPEGGTIVLSTRDVDLDAERSASTAEELEPGPYLELRVRDTAATRSDG